MNLSEIQVLLQNTIPDWDFILKYHEQGRFNYIEVFVGKLNGPIVRIFQKEKRIFIEDGWAIEESGFLGRGLSIGIDVSATRKNVRRKIFDTIKEGTNYK